MRRAVFERFAAGGRTSFRHRRERPDGSVFEVRGEPLPDGGFVIILEDVTERARAEAAARIDDARLRKAFAQADIAMNVCDRDGAYVEVNDAFCRLVGYEARELRALRFAAITHPDDLAMDMAHHRALVAGDDSGRVFEKRYLRKDGTTVWAKLSVTMLRDVEGCPDNTIALIEDITARRRAIVKRRTTRTLLTRALDSVSDGFALFGADGRLAMVNRHFRGYHPDGGKWIEIGRTFEELVRAGVAGGHLVVPPGDEEAYIHKRLDKHARAEPAVVETSDGRWLRAHDHRLPDGSCVAIRTDVTDLVHSARALATSEERLRTLTNNLPGVVFSFEYDPATTERRVTYISETVRDVLGVDRAAVLSGEARLIDHMLPEDLDAFLVVMAESACNLEPLECDMRFAGPGRTTVWIRIIATPRRLVDGVVRWDGIGLDVTAHRAAEEQLRQSLKMEALGQLTGGVAHDFNNVLTVMMGSADLLSDSVAEGDTEGRQLLRNITMAGAQGADLTRRLLAFARRQPLNPETLDIDRLVGELAPLLKRALGDEFVVVPRPGAGRRAASVDRHQLENAILNLATNARDAMPDGGRITIGTSVIALDAARGERLGGLPAGEYVRIDVADHGSGMPSDVAARATEPFFTTKPEGKGTGLGLSMVYGFVRQTGGGMEIDSAPRRGTTIRLYLPCLQADDAHAPRRARTASPSGHEAVLLVEDEPAVRDTLQRMLRSLGYEVMCAASGQEALARIVARERIDLLFTDLAMPGGIDGRKLADAAMAVRPSLRILYLSGNSEQSVVRNGCFHDDAHLLEKPFTLDELARSVRGALGDPTASLQI